MTRPPSIVRFERLYLASFVLGIASRLLGWNTVALRLAGDPRTAPFTWILPVSLVLGVAISLLLWYFAARRASVVAKWIIVVLTGFAMLRFVLNLPAMTRGVLPLADVLVSTAAVLLGVAAAVQLFRADARSWFGEDETIGDVE